MYLQVPPGWGGIGQVGMAAAAVPGFSQNSSQSPADTEMRVSVINLKDGTRLAGEDAPKRKDLEQWLKEHPGFVADTGAFIPVSPYLLSLQCFCSVTVKLPKKERFPAVDILLHELFSISCAGGK